MYDMARRIPLAAHALSAAQLGAARVAVASERDRRGWSPYDAATASGGNASHQTWRNFEDGSTASLTDKMRIAVERAFDWEHDWPTRPPAPQRSERITTSRAQALDDKLDVILRKLDEDPTRGTLRDRLNELTEAVHQMGDAIDDLRRRRPA